MRRRGALVPGAALCDEILRDVEAVFATEENALLTLQEASARSGYSPEHLGRLLRDGTIPNSGRRYAPRILRRHLPCKPGALRTEASTPQLVGATPGQIARAVVTSQGDPR